MKRVRNLRTYSSWMNMWTRCTNPNSDRYKFYGARGITIDPKWKSYAAFVDDMGERPMKMTLDRVDNNGNYCKTNCRWATKKQQGNNTRSNNRIIAFGETKTMKEWASDMRCVCDYSTLNFRLKAGWPPEIAITSEHRSDPLLRRRDRHRKNAVMVSIGNEIRPLMDWVDDPRCACKEMAFRYRIAKGMDPWLALITPPKQISEQKPAA